MIEAKEKPKYYQLRWKLSNFFVKIAQKIYPENPELKAFILQLMQDQLFYEESIVRINPCERITEEIKIT